MDTLRNKTYINYNYINRYANVPSYYDTLSNKYISGVYKNMLKTAIWTTHKVAQGDNLDYLALKYYNDPTFWWVIAYFNDVQDPFISLIDHFTTLKIPNISMIEFGDLR